MERRSHGHGPLGAHPPSLQELQREERCPLCRRDQGGQVKYNQDASETVHLNSNTFDCLYYVCDSLMKDYFYKPPINQLSLTFLDKSLESAYRISYQEEVCVCLVFYVI